MRPPRPGLAASSWICSSCRSSVTLRKLPAAPPIRQYASQPRKGKLPDGPVRTRFAPSPTGNLHLGSIRTALFNYLLARRTKGRFLLRIEDTDQKRTVPGAEEKLCSDLQWAGLQWDEGPIVGGPFGPYRQSERTAIYREHVEPLLKSKRAYRCFCSAKRLDALNKSRHENGQALGYDRRCTDLSEKESDERAHNGQAHVVRFRMPEKQTGYTDLVYGKTGKEKPRQLQTDDLAFEDPILIKSDGFPTYHFANVVDDHLMKITHVIRGSEWMTSTPLHIALYDAFGWSAPAFGHVPLLVDGRSQKLSKRDFKSDLSNYRDALGVYPDALVNFAALLGWSHQQGNDVMNLGELEEVFDLKITKGNTVVSLEKLHYLQKQHAKRYIREGSEMFMRMVQETVAAVQDYVAVGAETLREASGEELSGDVSETVGDTTGVATERDKLHDQRIQKFLCGRSLDGVVRLMLQSEYGPYERPKEFVKSFEGFFSARGHRDSYPADGEYSLEALCIAAGALCFTPAEYWIADVHKANMAALEPPPLHTVHDPKERVKIWRTALNQFMRLALLDGQPGPSIPHTMAILGKDVCTERLQSAALIVREQTTLTTKPEMEIKSAIKDIDNRAKQIMQGESLPPEKAFRAHRLVPATCCNKVEKQGLAQLIVDTYAEADMTATVSTLPPPNYTVTPGASENAVSSASGSDMGTYALAEPINIDIDASVNIDGQGNTVMLPKRMPLQMLRQSSGDEVMFDSFPGKTEQLVEGILEALEGSGMIQGNDDRTRRHLHININTSVNLGGENNLICSAEDKATLSERQQGQGTGVFEVEAAKRKRSISPEGRHPPVTAESSKGPTTGKQRKGRRTTVAEIMQPAT